MNNTINESFLLRRTNGSLNKNGEYMYEEDFYINQQRPSIINGGMLNVFAYGECLWRKGHRIKMFRKSQWRAFEYIKEGCMEVLSKGNKIKAFPGDIIIVNPGETMALKTGEKSPMKKQCLLIEGPVLDCVYNNGILMDMIHIKSEETFLVEEILKNIKGMILSGNESPEQALSVQAYYFLTEINRLALPLRYPLPLRKAIKKIDAAPGKNYSLKSLSAECGISISSLSRLFQKHFNTSPVNYIIDRRLELAKTLLNINGMGLKEIAGKTGYRTESFLSRSFKKKFGIPPAFYRKNTYEV